MKSIITILTVAFLATFVITSCEKEDTGEGTVRLSITDAPVDTDGIQGVYITVTEVHYSKSGSDWEKFVFDEPQTFNLLDLQRGDSEMMGSFKLSAGTYSQLRFLLDAPEAEGAPVSNPGCYLEMEGGNQLNLFVPSGAQTGYKAVGSFDVPVNGEVEITADFDARKSVVKAGNSGKYLLKPSIRLIVNNQAGHIAGQVNNISEGTGIMVYAYEEGTYAESEAGEPSGEEVRFPNAETSDMVDEGNNYQLSYLSPGLYDIIVVSTLEGAFNEVLDTLANVEVKSQITTNLDINIDEL